MQKLSGRLSKTSQFNGLNHLSLISGKKNRTPYKAKAGQLHHGPLGGKRSSASVALDTDTYHAKRSALIETGPYQLNKDPTDRWPTSYIIKGDDLHTGTSSSRLLYLAEIFVQARKFAPASCKWWTTTRWTGDHLNAVSNHVVILRQNSHRYEFFIYEHPFKQTVCNAKKLSKCLIMYRTRWWWLLESDFLWQSAVIKRKQYWINWYLPTLSSTQRQQQQQQQQ